MKNIVHPTQKNQQNLFMKSGLEILFKPIYSTQEIQNIFIIIKDMHLLVIAVNSKQLIESYRLM